VEIPDKGLCCTTSPVWQLPELEIPEIMQEMNYGCGTTVQPRDLINNPTVLYVGVGGGMELLQFAYFSRKPHGVIGIDIVDEMLDASKRNFVEAERLNPWFQSEFIDLRKGDALNLPIGDNSVDVVAQNCLFNIFKYDEKGHVLLPDQPLPVCDKTAKDLRKLNRNDIYISPSTYFYDGGGCC
jgi:SAM-dependent methyltransferase